MGSRRRRYAALVVALASASCTSGPPPGFSDGDQWTIPLIAPLENGLLLVPALVNGKGPFVFAIDPDAQVSAVDQQVVTEADARTGEGPRLLDETDTERPRFYAEILEWQLGSLTVKQKPAQLVPKGTFDTAGRRIHGLIGRDIIADSIVFAFDRELGLITLTTVKAFKPLPAATSISYELLSSRIPNAEVLPVSRKLITAAVNNAPFKLHVDFGMVASQLRTRSFSAAQMPPNSLSGDSGVIDEVGTVRTIQMQSSATKVSVALDSLFAKNVVFVPYGDRRWLEQDLEGTLGLDFFSQFAVAANWHDKRFYLSPRTPAALPARLSRWQSKTLAACATPGCVKITLIDPVANKPTEETQATHPGLVASVVREAVAQHMELEVLIAVQAAPGKPVLQWLVANFPAGTDRAMTHLHPDYLGATLTVVDASPFPRTCPVEGACVDRVAPPN